MRVELLSSVVDSGATVYLLVRLVADAAPDKERNPVNLTVVIDRSSSMRGPRIAQAKRAASQLIDRLDHRDRLTVISFDAQARIVFGPAAVTEDARPKLIAALNSIETGVGTNLAAGIRKGADALASGYVRGAVSRLILLTDGQPSVGMTDGERLCALVEAEVERGVTTTTMGIGEGFEDELLAEMARRGRGGFHYLATAPDIPAAFGQELAGVFAIAAQDTDLKLVPAADVVSIDLIHRLPSRPQEDGLLVEIGDVAAGAPRQVLFRLGRNPMTESRRLGTLMLTYQRPGGEKSDGHIIGVELDAVPDNDDVQTVTLERLRLAVASSVDLAWARRASGDSIHALAALADIKRQVVEARDQRNTAEAAANELLEDIELAEQAVAKSAAEREKIRRSMKERSQITLLGQSTIRHLPDSDDD